MSDQILKVSEIVQNIEKAIDDSTIQDYLAEHPSHGHAFIKGKMLLIDVELHKINIVGLVLASLAEKNAKS